MGFGIVVGIGAAFALNPLTGKNVPLTNVLIPAVVVIMTVVGFVAAAGRRAVGCAFNPLMR